MAILTFICSVTFGIISFYMWLDDAEFRDIGLATALCLLFLIISKLEWK